MGSTDSGVTLPVDSADTCARAEPAGRPRAADDVRSSHAEFRFCFTFDTEPDDLWHYKPVPSFEHFPRLPDFHRRLCDAGARPTHLTTSEVVENASARKAMRECLDIGNCEIGAHFHTWTRPWPFPFPDLGNPPIKAHAAPLGPDVEQRMLAYTCDALRSALGIEPRSYRGGCWSLGPLSARALANCGIRVDSTVTPGISWIDPAHPFVNGPDYRHHPRAPYWLGSGAAGAVGRAPRNASSDDFHNGIVELPVGAAYFPEWLSWGLKNPFVFRLARRLGMDYNLLVGHRWLRPTIYSRRDLRATMRVLKSLGVPVWVFMIHSSEIIPCTKLPSQDRVDAFMNRCIDAVRDAIDLGAKPATLTEAAEWSVRQGYMA